MLQDAITAQHNAGQEAALQALQNAIAHVLQPMQAHVLQIGHHAGIQL